MSVASSVNLQATLAAASAGDKSSPPCFPHHPVTCQGALGFDVEDGSLACPHVKTGPHDVRTAQAVTHSVAIMLIELASEL